MENYRSNNSHNTRGLKKLAVLVALTLALSMLFAIFGSALSSSLFNSTGSSSLFQNNSVNEAEAVSSNPGYSYTGGTSTDASTPAVFQLSAKQTYQYFDYYSGSMGTQTATAYNLSLNGKGVETWYNDGDFGILSGHNNGTKSAWVAMYFYFTNRLYYAAVNGYLTATVNASCSTKDPGNFGETDYLDNLWGSIGLVGSASTFPSYNTGTQYQSATNNATTKTYAMTTANFTAAQLAANRYLRIHAGAQETGRCRLNFWLDGETIKIAIASTDAAAPTVNGYGNGSTVYTSSASISIADAASGMYSYSYSGPSSGSGTYSSENTGVGGARTFNLPSPGKYTVTVVDNVGNTNTSTVYYYNPTITVSTVTGGSSYISTSASATSGSASINPGLTTSGALNSYYLYATPSSGYYLMNWSGNSTNFTQSVAAAGNVNTTTVRSAACTMTKVISSFATSDFGVSPVTYTPTFGTITINVTGGPYSSSGQFYIYNGAALNVSATLSGGSGVVYFSYSGTKLTGESYTSNGSASGSGTAPSLPGTYTVTAKAYTAANGVYLGYATKTVTIAPIALTFTATAAPKNYDGGTSVTLSSINLGVDNYYYSMILGMSAPSLTATDQSKLSVNFEPAVAGSYFNNPNYGTRTATIPGGYKLLYSSGTADNYSCFTYVYYTKSGVPSYLDESAYSNLSAINTAGFTVVNYASQNGAYTNGAAILKHLQTTAMINRLQIHATNFQFCLTGTTTPATTLTKVYDSTAYVFANNSMTGACLLTTGTGQTVVLKVLGFSNTVPDLGTSNTNLQYTAADYSGSAFGITWATCVINGSKVDSTGYSITITGLAITGSGKNNYTYTSGENTKTFSNPACTITRKVVAAGAITAPALSPTVYRSSDIIRNTGTDAYASYIPAATNWTINQSALVGSDVGAGTVTIATLSTSVFAVYQNKAVAGGTLPGKAIGDKDVIIYGFNIGGASAGNYDFTAYNKTYGGTSYLAVTTTGSITPATITAVTLTASNKIFDNSNSASTTYALSGVVAGDSVTITYTATFADKNVLYLNNQPTFQTVTARGISINESSDITKAGYNYILASSMYKADSGDYQTTATATITPKYFDASVAFKYNGTSAVTITYGTAGIGNGTLDNALTSYVYNGSAKTPSFTLTDALFPAGLSNGNDYTFSYSNNVNASPAANLTFVGTKNYYGTVSVNFTINKDILSLSFVTEDQAIDSRFFDYSSDSLFYIYGNAYDQTAITRTDVDALAAKYARRSTDNTAVACTWSVISSDNIVPAKPTVKYADSSITAGQTELGLSYYSIVVRATPSDATNYYIPAGSDTITVKVYVIPKELTITAPTESFIYGEEPKALNAVFSGLVAGETIAQASSVSNPLAAKMTVQGIPDFYLYATANTVFKKDCGEYPIAQGTYYAYSISGTTVTYNSAFTVGGIVYSGLRNYDVTFVPGTLTITPRYINITPNNQTKVYGESDPVFTYAVSLTTGRGANKDYALAKFGDGSPADTISPAHVLTRANAASQNVGSYLITQGGITGAESLEGNYPNYYITFIATSMLTIERRNIYLNVDDITQVFGDLSTAVYTSGSLAGSSAYSGGEVVLRYSLAPGSAFYYGDIFGDSLVRQAPVMSGGTVSQWANRPIVFDTTVGTFAINYVPETDENSPSYKNYNIFVTNNGATKTYIAGVLRATEGNATTSYDDYVVTKRPITIKPTPGQGITYGSAMMPLTYTAYYNGVAAGAEVPGYLLSGEIYAMNGATRITSQLTVVGVAQGGVGAGSYPYSQGSITATANSNYQISFDTGESFVISPKPISITAILRKSSYMQDPPADSTLGYNTTGLVGTDSFLISLTLGSYLPTLVLSYRPATDSTITLVSEGSELPSFSFIDFGEEDTFTLTADLAADTYCFLIGSNYYSFVAETSIAAGSILTFENETTLTLTTFPSTLRSLPVFGYGSTAPSGTVLSFVSGVYTVVSDTASGTYYALVNGEYFYFELPELVAGDSITLDSSTMDMLYYWNNSAASLPFRPNAYSPITDVEGGITYDIYLSYAAWLYAFSAQNPNYNVNKNYVISSFDGVGKLERIPKTAVIYPVLNQSVEYGTRIKTTDGEAGYALKFVALIDDEIDVTSEISGYIFLYGDVNYSSMSVKNYSYYSYDDNANTINTLQGTGFNIDYQYMESKAWDPVARRVVDTTAYFEVRKKDITVFFREEPVTNYFGENDIILDSAYYTVVAGKYTDDLPITYTNGLIGDDVLNGTLMRTAGRTVGYYNVTLGSLGNSSYNIYFNTASGAAKYEITRRPVVVHPIAVSAVYAGLNTSVRIDYTVTDKLTGINYTSTQATSAANTIIAGYPLSGSLSTNAAIQNVGSYTYILNTLSSANNSNYYITLDSNVIRTTYAASGTTSDTILTLYGTTAPGGTVLPFVNSVYTASASGLDAGTYYIQVNGNYYSFTTNALAAGDTLTYTVSAYTVTPKKIVVYVNNAASKQTSVTQIYGEAETSYRAVATGLIAGDSIAGGFVRVGGSGVGQYVISPDAILADNVNNNKNYTITYDTVNPVYYYSITPRPITVTPNSDLSKFYDGTEPAASALLYQVSRGAGTTGAPLVGADNLNGSLAKSAGVGVGVYEITQGTLTNANNPNYIITFNAGATYTINKVTVGFVHSGTADITGAFTFVYDTSEHSVDFTIKNAALNDFMALYMAESGYSITCTVLSEASGLSTPSFSVVHAGNYTLTYRLKETANFAAVTRQITVKVSPYTLTITPAAASKVYGSPDPTSAFTATATALTGDPAVNVVFGRVAGETVGEYVYINAVSDNSDYRVVFGGGAGKFAITPYNLRVSASSGVFTKTFGNADPALTEDFSTGLFSDVVTVTYTRATGAEFELVGTYSLTSVTGSDNLNYTYSFAENGGKDKFVISRKTITVTAAPKSHVYNPSASDVELTILVEGLVDGYPLEGFVQRTDSANYHAGTYQIIADEILADNVGHNVNYTVVYIPALYTITRAPVTITPVAVSAQYGDYLEVGETEVLAYTLSGTVYEGDILQGELARVNTDSSAPSYLGTVGTYRITRGTMTNANNPDYNITFAENVEYVIHPRTIVLAPKNTSQIYGDPRTLIAIDTIVSGTLVGDDSLAGEFEIIGEGYNVGTYNIGIGTMDSANVNYSVSLAEGIYYYLINARPITIVADPVTQNYGDSEKPLTYSISSGNLVGSDALSGALAREAGTDVGSYPISLGNLGNNNYLITFVSNFYTVSKRLLTVKINDQSIRYGEAIVVAQDDYTVTSGSVIPGDDLGIVISKAAGTAMGSYTLSATSDNPNYIITFVRGIFTIRKYDAVINVPFTSLTVLYDGNVRTIGATASSGAPVSLHIGGEKVADSFSAPGKYYITLSAPETDNSYAPENVIVRITILATSLSATESGIDATINNKDGFDPDLVLDMKKVSKDDTELNAYLGKNQEIVRGFNIEVIDANQEAVIGSTTLRIKIPAALAEQDSVTVLLKQNGVYSTREVENIEGYVELEVDNLSSIAFIQSVSNNGVVFIVVGIAAAIIIGSTLFFAFKRRY